MNDIINQKRSYFSKVVARLCYDYSKGKYSSIDDIDTHLSLMKEYIGDEVVMESLWNISQNTPSTPEFLEMMKMFLEKLNEDKEYLKNQ